MWRASVMTLIICQNVCSVQMRVRRERKRARKWDYERMSEREREKKEWIDVCEKYKKK